MNLGQKLTANEKELLTLLGNNRYLWDFVVESIIIHRF